MIHRQTALVGIESHQRPDDHPESVADNQSVKTFEVPEEDTKQKARDILAGSIATNLLSALGQRVRRF